MSTTESTSEVATQQQIAIVQDGAWVEVRFVPPTDKPIHECVKEVIALFEQHYDLREQDGQKVFGVRSETTGNPKRECALFIKQRPGGREVPQGDVMKAISE